MKYEDWIKYEEARLAEKKKNVSASMMAAAGKDKAFGTGARVEASYRERCLVEVLLQQQALIDALQAQISSMQPVASAIPL